MPEGNGYDRYLEIIFGLSRQLSTPAFLPHVTLLGLIEGVQQEVESRAIELAAQLHPFRIEFDEVKALNEYFRCLFIRVKESAALTAAHQQACNLFGRHDDPPFMPHLSLVYGNLAPLAKEKIFNDLGREAFLPFEVRSLHLFETLGEPPDWRRLREIRFGKQ